MYNYLFFYKFELNILIWDISPGLLPSLFRSILLHVVEVVLRVHPLPLPAPSTHSSAATPAPTTTTVLNMLKSRKQIIFIFIKINIFYIFIRMHL